MNALAASRREPEIAVGTVLLRGSVSDRLVELSESSELVVLGVDTTVPRPMHGLLGPVEDRVVGQAHCPVVTVNGPVPDTKRVSPVVAFGWVDTRTGHRALRVAADEAVLHGASLTVISAGWPLGTDADPAGSTEADRSLRERLAAYERTHADVSVDIVHARAGAAEALLRHSGGADLLVIGSYHTADRFSIRTGAVAEQVIRGATCPVMLVGRRMALSPTGRAPAVAETAPGADRPGRRFGS